MLSALVSVPAFPAPAGQVGVHLPALPSASAASKKTRFCIYNIDCPLNCEAAVVAAAAGEAACLVYGYSSSSFAICSCTLRVKVETGCQVRFIGALFEMVSTRGDATR